MAIALTQDFKKDRMLNDIIYLPFDANACSVNVDKVTTASVNTSIAKLYQNLKFLYSYSFLERPVTNDVDFASSEFISKVALSGQHVCAAAGFDATSNQLVVFSCSQTKITVTRFDCVNYSNDLAGNLSKSMAEDATEIFLNDFPVQFSSILDCTFDQASGMLYVLDTGNIYKIDFSSYFKPLVDGQTYTYKLVEVTQGYKDVLAVEFIGITGNEKKGISGRMFRHTKLTYANNLVFVINQSQGMNSINVFDDSLNISRVITLPTEYGTLLDIDARHGNLYVITASKHMAVIKLSSLRAGTLSITTQKLMGSGYFSGVSVDSSNDNRIFFSGSGTSFSDTFRVYRTFTSKTERVIDSFAPSGTTNSLFVLPVDITMIDLSKVHATYIVTAGSSGTSIVKMFMPQTKITSDEMTIYDETSAYVSGDEYINAIIMNKSLYKLMYDNYQFVNSLLGQFNGNIITAKVRNGHDEFRYNGIIYPEKELLETPVSLVDPDNFISTNEVFCTSAVNRCIRNIVELQLYARSLIAARLDNIAEYGIQI